MKRVLGVSGCAVCNVLRALCSEGALCTGALCAGAVPAVLPSEHSIVFMCARTHKGHIVPWSCSCSQLASAVLRGRTVYGRPVRWRCACRTALGAFDCVYVCAHTQRPHRAHGRVRARSLRARATPASGLCSCSRGVRAQATPAYWSLLCGPSGMKPSSEDVRRLGWDAMHHVRDRLARLLPHLDGRRSPPAACTEARRACGAVYRVASVRKCGAGGGASPASAMPCTLRLPPALARHPRLRNSELKLRRTRVDLRNCHAGWPALAASGPRVCVARVCTDRLLTVDC